MLKIRDETLLTSASLQGSRYAGIHAQKEMLLISGVVLIFSKRSRPDIVPGQPPRWLIRAGHPRRLEGPQQAEAASGRASDHARLGRGTSGFCRGFCRGRRPEPRASDPGARGGECQPERLTVKGRWGAGLERERPEFWRGFWRPAVLPV